MAPDERRPDQGAAGEIDELLARCLSVAESDDEAALESLLAQHPEHAEVLRRRLALLRRAGFAAAPGEAFELPETLGEYRLLRQLGGGGMGLVYLAEQTPLGRRVALKLIRPEHLYFPGARARFLREAQAVARLAHPGIVQVYAVGESSGVPFIAMELVEGVALSDLLATLRARGAATLHGGDLLDELRRQVEPSAIESADGKSNFDREWSDLCAWIGRELAQALEHAHQRGVVHRDVKPFNVMLTPSGRVLLVDFGLAQATGADALTRTGAAQGSLPYMAPEQVAGRNDEVGPRTDVYGLGVTLYELAALRRPFEFSDETRLRAAILGAAPRRLRSVAPSISTEFDAVVSVALAHEPRRRYRSAADLARDLSHVLAREPIEARPASVLERAQSWARRHPAQALAGALALVIVVGGPTSFGVVQARAARKERQLGAQLERSNELAERRNDELADANEQLRSQSTALSAALESESRERRRAEENFAHALDAVDTMLTQVGVNKLEDVPHMEAIRRDLLEDALKFYSRFVVQGAEDPSVRVRSAITLRKVSLIREELGDLVGARDAAASAMRELRALVDDGATLPDFDREWCAALAQHATTLLALREMSEAEAAQRELLERLARLRSDPLQVEYALSQSAMTQQHLAFLLRDTGRAPEAMEHAQLGVEWMREWYDRYGAAATGAAALHKLGTALQSLAIMRRGHVSADQSEREFADAIALLQRAVEREPDNPRLRESLSSIFGNLGLFLSQQELDHGFRPGGIDAESALRASQSITAELVAIYPRRALYRSGLASSASNLCVHLARTGRSADARVFAEVAVEALTALVELSPEVPDHRRHLGSSLCNLARLELMGGHVDKALEVLERARGELLTVAVREAQTRPFGGQLRFWGITWIEALIAARRWEQAASELPAFARDNRDANALVWVVERTVQCSELARADQDAVERSQALRDAAVELLREIFASGNAPTNIARMESLEPLRDHEGFIALLSEVK